MPCKICGKELSEGMSVCHECARENKENHLGGNECDDKSDIILIERRPRPDEPGKDQGWTGKYTPDQRAGFRHRFGFSDKEINVLEEANNFVRNLLTELKVQDPASLKLEENKVLRQVYSARVQGFLNERELKKEVTEALAHLKDGYDLQVLLKDKNRKFGAALASLLFILK